LWENYCKNVDKNIKKEYSLRRGRIVDKLVLISPGIEYKKDAQEYIKEFIENHSEINGSGGLHRYINDYKNWLKKIKDDININANETDKVPANTFFAVRDHDKKIIGMVNIRHKLNEKLKIKGGYIGYSVRPSERRKGYATEILKLGLEKLKEMGINKVLVTCDKDNIGSAKTIQNNLGILKDELVDKDTGKIIQRYWIIINDTVKIR
jgi:predicted acetyltransferase